jgi:hypothetical protein
MQISVYETIIPGRCSKREQKIIVHYIKDTYYPLKLVTFSGKLDNIV